MKKNSLLALLLLLISAVSFAQTRENNKASADSVTSMMNAMQYEKPLHQRPIAVGVGLGLAGIAIDGRLGITPKLNARLGLNILPLGYTWDKFKFETILVDIKLKSNFTNIHLLAEYQPIEKLGIRVVGGLSYLVGGKANLDLQPNGTYKYGDIKIGPNQVGNVKCELDWRGIAPYLGLNFFKDMARQKGKFAVNLDLGTYYLSAPDVTITGTKMLAANKENEAQLEKNLKGYRWMPVLQVNVNYRIQ